MKRDFVKDLFKDLNLEASTLKPIIDAIIEESGNELTELQNKIKGLETEKTTLATERDDLKTQISSRDTDIEALKEKVKDNESLTSQLADLQTKYTTDTDNLNAKLKAQEKSHATEKFFEGYKFTSNLARAAAIAEFEKKELKYEDGKFLGAEDFMKTMMEENPTAFVEEKKEPTPPPTFVSSTGGSPAGSPNPFNFGFSGVRSIPTEK